MFHSTLLRTEMIRSLSPLRENTACRMILNLWKTAWFLKLKGPIFNFVRRKSCTQVQIRTSFESLKELWSKAIDGTLTFSRWSWRESMRRSPTGCQDPLITSAWRSLRSSSSVASWSSWSLSRASSSFLCQSAECRFNFSHSVLTSSACFRRSRVTFWALSSGGSSKLVIWQGFRPQSFLFKKKKTLLKRSSWKKESTV